MCGRRAWSIRRSGRSCRCSRKRQHLFDRRGAELNGCCEGHQNGVRLGREARRADCPQLRVPYAKEWNTMARCGIADPEALLLDPTS